MIPFTLGELKFELPDDWSKITVGQTVAIKKLTEPGLFPQIAILSGADLKLLQEAECSEKDLDLLVLYLNDFNSRVPDWGKLPIPTHLNFGGKAIEVPQDLNLKTAAQKYLFRTTIFPCVERTGDVIEALPDAIAIYFQPLFTGQPFDGDDLNKYIAMANECLAIEAYPVASFFLNRYVESKLMSLPS